MSNTREKYLSAIEFLIKERNEKIVTVDANGTMEEVLRDVIKLLVKNAPHYFKVDSSIIANYQIPTTPTFDQINNQTITLQTLIQEVKQQSPQDVTQFVVNRFDQLHAKDKGILFFDYIKTIGYQIIERFSTTNHPVFKLEYQLPGGITQKGMLIVMEAFEQSNMLLETVSNLIEMADFMFVFAMGKSSSTTPFYERDKIQFSSKIISLFPATQIITEAAFVEIITTQIHNQPA